MTVQATSGVPVTLLAHFTSDGVTADPSLPVLLSIVPAAGGDAVLSGAAVTRPAVGIFSYVWTPPDVDAPTDFVVTWDPAGDDISAVDVVNVLPAVMGTWATVEEVSQVTGKTVTAETLALASSIISTVSGADVEMPSDAITAKDRRHLRRATAWQAVWIPTKPGLITDRENAASVTSDTQAIVRDQPMDALLAPLAKRELLSLSWVGTRTAILRGPRPGWTNRNFLNEQSDPKWLGGEGAIP